MGPETCNNLTMVLKLVAGSSLTRVLTLFSNISSFTLSFNGLYNLPGRLFVDIYFVITLRTVHHGCVIILIMSSTILDLGVIVYVLYVCNYILCSILM